MKKIIILLSFPVLLIGQTARLNEKKIFKNYAFGASPDKYKNLVLEDDRGNTKFYSFKKENLKINGVELKYLRLIFFKNKLSGISIKTKNKNGCKLYQRLKEHYGVPVKSNYAEKKYKWNGNKTELIFEKCETEPDALVSFYSYTVF